MPMSLAMENTMTLFPDTPCRKVRASHHNGHDARVGLVGIPHLHGVVEGQAFSQIGRNVLQEGLAVELLGHAQ